MMRGEVYTSGPPQSFLKRFYYRCAGRITWQLPCILTALAKIRRAPTTKLTPFPDGTGALPWELF